MRAITMRAGFRWCPRRFVIWRRENSAQWKLFGEAHPTVDLPAAVGDKHGQSQKQTAWPWKLQGEALAVSLERCLPGRRCKSADERLDSVFISASLKGDALELADLLPEASRSRISAGGVGRFGDANAWEAMAMRPRPAPPWRFLKPSPSSPTCSQPGTRQFSKENSCGEARMPA